MENQDVEKKMMSIYAEDGSIEEVEVILAFEFKDTNKEYVIYTKNEIDDNVTVVKTKYKVGGREGSIAIIGPKRMEYERVINMLEYLKEHIEAKGKGE